MATPVVKSLRRHFPEAQISFLVDRTYAEILEGNPHLHEVVTYDRDRDGTWSFWRAVRAKRFDLVMDLWCTGRTAAWTLATGARWRVGFNHRIRRWAYNVRVHSSSTYAGDINLDCVRALGLEETDHRPELFLEDRDRVFAHQWLSAREGMGEGQWVMLAPGARYAAKRWPAERFAEVGEALVRQSGVELFLLEGPQDQQAVQSVMNRLTVRAHVVKQTTLRQTAALISMMQAYIGNDSGPMHMAVALGVPTVTVLGPTNSDFIAPFGRHAEVRHRVPCSPCAYHECPLPKHLCMDGVSVGEVIQKVQKVLQS